MFRPQRPVGPVWPNNSQLNHGRMHHGPQNPAAPPWLGQVGQATLRVPPPLSPEMENAFPFRHWILDTVMWSMATDLDEVRKGPAVTLQLGGLARDVAREIPPNVLANGDVVDLGDGV